jgi:hypothetical protein
MQLCAVLGWTVPVREVVKAVTEGVMQERVSDVERRWRVGGRLRDDVEGARGAAEARDPQTIGRRSGLSRRGLGSLMTRTSLNASLSRRERDTRNPLDQRGTLTVRMSRATRRARDASDLRCPLQR